MIGRNWSQLHKLTAHSLCAPGHENTTKAQQITAPKATQRHMLKDNFKAIWEDLMQKKCINNYCIISYAIEALIRSQILYTH